MGAQVVLGVPSVTVDESCVLSRFNERGLVTKERLTGGVCELGPC